MTYDITFFKFSSTFTDSETRQNQITNASENYQKKSDTLSDDNHLLFRQYKNVCML